MEKNTTPIQIGSLVRTPIGVFGVVSKINKKDKMYIVSWTGGMRKGDTVAYDKKMFEQLLRNDGWKLFSPGEELQ